MGCWGSPSFLRWENPKKRRPKAPKGETAPKKEILSPTWVAGGAGPVARIGPCPAGVVILVIGRGDGYVVPRGQTRIEPYDTLLLLGAPAALYAAVDSVLTPKPRVRSQTTAEDPLAMLPLTTDERYLSRQVVVVGYGDLGRRVCDALAARNVPFIVAERNRAIVQGLRDRDVPAVVGDASLPMVLAQAHVARAAILAIAAPDAAKVREMVENARRMNPRIEIVVGTYSEEEAVLLRAEGTGTVLLAEEELAAGVTRYILQRVQEAVGPPGKE